MTGDPEYTLLYYPHNIADLLDLGTGDPRWSGSTALHGAIISNQPSVVQYLVDRGADLDAKTDTGWTPLMMARGALRLLSRLRSTAAKHGPHRLEIARTEQIQVIQQVVQVV